MNWIFKLNLASHLFFRTCPPIFIVTIWSRFFLKLFDRIWSWWLPTEIWTGPERPTLKRRVWSTKWEISTSAMQEVGFSSLHWCFSFLFCWILFQRSFIPSVMAVWKPVHYSDALYQSAGLLESKPLTFLTYSDACYFSGHGLPTIL